MPVPEAIVVYLPRSATIIQGLGEDHILTKKARLPTLGPELHAVMPEDTQGHVSWTETSPANRLVAIAFGIA